MVEQSEQVGRVEQGEQVEQGQVILIVTGKVKKYYVGGQKGLLYIRFSPAYSASSPFRALYPSWVAGLQRMRKKRCA